MQRLHSLSWNFLPLGVTPVNVIASSQRRDVRVCDTILTPGLGITLIHVQTTDTSIARHVCVLVSLYTPTNKPHQQTCTHCHSIHPPWRPLLWDSLTVQIKRYLAVKVTPPVTSAQNSNEMQKIGVKKNLSLYIVFSSFQLIYPGGCCILNPPALPSCYLGFYYPSCDIFPIHSLTCLYPLVHLLCVGLTLPWLCFALLWSRLPL